ncbi:MAG: anthranilate synthase component I family protein [Clostridiaceae bacterium]|nr:anthranilate synthase component I family protein [Clostridiaceae bacterium]
MKIVPSYSEIERMAEEYNIIPVCREIYADIITPITLLRKIAGISNRYCLLESVEGDGKWSRYSFICFNPIAHLRFKNGQLTLAENGVVKKVPTLRPFKEIRAFLARYKAPRIEKIPPFAGGLVGYFSYSMIGYIESAIKLRNSEFNDFDLMMFDKVIAYDHQKQKMCIVVNMRTDKKEANYRKALSDIEDIISLIKSQPVMPEKPINSSPYFTCNVSKDEFCLMVNKAKEYIKEGEIYQAVLSRRFETEHEHSLLNAYRVLRTTNPSPYMVFMQNGDIQLMSASPETLVRLHNGILSTFPIAGTRPRGKDSSEDKAFEQELLEDCKELAEHDMLIDLARNDLGKISAYSSIHVVNYKKIQRCSKIMHIASEVEGSIMDGKDALDAIEALLPAGTLSGAPKIRACQIIEELEKEPRGIYGGAIGYIDFTGNMDVCIAIRMAVKKNNKVYIQAGSGIVADSIPEKEYEETENKARALMEAVISASEVDG